MKIPAENCETITMFATLFSYSRALIHGLLQLTRTISRHLSRPAPPRFRKNRAVSKLSDRMLLDIGLKRFHITGEDDEHCPVGPAGEPDPPPVPGAAGGLHQPVSSSARRPRSRK